MPILTPGQERKSGRRWVSVAVAVLGLPWVLLLTVALAVTVQPIKVSAGKYRLEIDHWPHSGTFLCESVFCNGETSTNEGRAHFLVLRCGNQVWFVTYSPW